MTTTQKIRIDKWLWAIRIFKTRTLASDACKAGRVKIGGQSVKASRLIKIGDTVSVQKGPEKKIVKAISLIEKRVGASIAINCYEDLSPPPPIKQGNKMQAVFFHPTDSQRDRGTGRPTKRERRVLDDFKKKR